MLTLPVFSFTHASLIQFLVLPIILYIIPITNVFPYDTYLVPSHSYLSVSANRVTTIFISLPSIPFYSNLFNGFYLSLPVLAAAPDTPLADFLESIFIIIHTFPPLSYLCFMLADFFQSANTFLHITLHFSSHFLIHVFIYFNSTHLHFTNNSYLYTYNCLHYFPWSDFRFFITTNARFFFMHSTYNFFLSINVLAAAPDIIL